MSDIETLLAAIGVTCIGWILIVALCLTLALAWSHIHRPPVDLPDEDYPTDYPDDILAG